MDEHCAHCPVDAGVSCRGGIYCAWAAGGDPVHLRHIRAVSGTPGGDVPPVPVATPAGAGGMLAGDLVEAMAGRIGADRLARWVADKLGADCGCAARRDRLNALDRKIRRFLGIDP